MYLSFKESTRLTREREGTFNRLHGLYYTAGNLIYLHKIYDVVPYYVWLQHKSPIFSIHQHSTHRLSGSIFLKREGDFFIESIFNKEFAEKN